MAFGIFVAAIKTEASHQESVQATAVWLGAQLFNSARYISLFARN